MPDQTPPLVEIDELAEHIRCTVPAMLPGIADRIAESLMPALAKAWDQGYRTCGLTALSGHRGGSANPYRLQESR